MDGEGDGVQGTKGEGGAQAATQQGDQAAQAQQVVGAGADGDGEDNEALLAERDARIAELEGEIAQAAQTAAGAEKLRTEMDELRRQGEEQRVAFELTMAGGRSAKAATALLPDYAGDVGKLKEAEPWLFGAGTPAAMPTGTTGLPSAGAAGGDDGTQMRRWRRIAGLPEERE